MVGVFIASLIVLVVKGSFLLVFGILDNIWVFFLINIVIIGVFLISLVFSMILLACELIIITVFLLFCVLGTVLSNFLGIVEIKLV